MKPKCLHDSPDQPPSAVTVADKMTAKLMALTEHGPLCRLQTRLQEGRLYWFGNRVANLRYWLWRLSR